MVDSSSKFRPVGSYRGLRSGPNWSRSAEGSRSAAVDGTKQRLRDPEIGSPFTFRVVPPTTLVDALTGSESDARTSDIFDPLLREQFLSAEREFEAVRNNPNSTPEEITAAAQALAGGRAPTTSQVNIIDAATQVYGNNRRRVDRAARFRSSNFYATGEGAGAAIRRLDRYVGANGIAFDPQTAPETEANQTAVSDLSQALDVVAQLNRMVNTPPLTLLVNPQELSITYGKKQTYQDRSRFNYIFQSWGEEQVRLSVQGTSAGFVVGTRDGVLENGRTSSVSGYQYASKLDSAGWQNLMSLFSIYRNNGYIYDNSQVPRSEAHLFVGNIEISYDQFVYLGQFENFQYSYDESRQHGAISFSFEFVVSFMFDNASRTPVRRVRDPNPNLNALSSPSTAPTSLSSAPSSRSPESPAQDGSTAVLDPLATGIGLLGRRGSEGDF